MKNNIKISIAVIFVLLLILPVFAFELGTKNFFDSVPPTTLISPTTEVVVLSGSDSLEFKWGIGDPADTDSYDFRLYKGYTVTAANLISKQILSTNTNSIKINASVFEDNQIYTCSVIRIIFNGQKSERSFSSFRVIKK